MRSCGRSGYETGLLAPPEQDRLLLLAYETGRSEHPGLGLDYGPFATRVVELARARLERARVAATESRIEEILPRLAAADLFLAIACDRDVPGAWARLMDLHGGRLRSLARRLGVSDADADELAQDVTSEVSTPAAKSRTRTVLGTFDGSGSLHAWLSVILRRRIADRHRAHRPASLDESDIESRAAAGPGPAAAAADRESVDSLRGLFRAAFADLTPRERLVIDFRYRLGVRQIEIARLLRVGPPRVSRILAHAVGKIRESISALEPSAPGTWEQLAAAMQTFLAEQGQPSAAPNDPRTDTAR